MAPALALGPEAPSNRPGLSPSTPAPEESLFLEGNRKMAAGDAAGAERCFREALGLKPDFAEVLCNLGLLRERAGAHAEAEILHRRAIAIQPGAFQLYLNLGVLLMNLRRYAEAEQIFRQALLREPQSPVVWSNLGALMIRQNREERAEFCLRTAIALDSGYARAKFNLSYVLLRQGRFDEGWECLEARDWYAALDRHFTCPRWQGQPLAGQSLLIGLEAGHGDMIQFCRYAPVLKTLGARWLTVVCHPALKALFTSLTGVDEVFSFEDEVPKSGWDYWTPPLSLPYHCRTRLETIPAPIPYLRADPAKAAHWQAHLAGSALRVGLVWKGNPRFENDGERSLPNLDLLAPLGTVSGTRFFGLQKDLNGTESEASCKALTIQMLGDELRDFSDTAAVIANLDLIISVDTAVAHLAGAMGKPCWVLLPDHLTDWRWLKARDDSPWYPSHMRLFRQASGGTWPAVIAELAGALQFWIDARNRASA